MQSKKGDLVVIKSETNQRLTDAKCIKCRGPTTIKMLKTKQGSTVRIVVCKLCKFYIAEDLL